MQWKKEVSILVVVGIGLLCLMSFLLGMSFGVTTDEKNFINSVLPVLNVVGSWISGLGSFAAAIAAIWIANRQFDSNKEKLEICFYHALIGNNTTHRLVISAVCTGQKPSQVNSICIWGKNAETTMHVVKFDIQSDSIPINLSYGQKAFWILCENFEQHIADYLRDYCAGSAKQLEIYVNTTTERFKYIPPDSMKALIEKHVRNSDETNGVGK